MDKQEIGRIIEENWSIGKVIDVERCVNGVTNITHKILCQKDEVVTPYICKAYEPRTEKEAIEFEDAFMFYVFEKSGGMTSIPLKTKDDKTYIRHEFDGEERYWDLATFLPGDVMYTWIFNDVTDVSIVSSAVALANFQNWGIGFEGSYDTVIALDRLWNMKKELDEMAPVLMAEGKHRKFITYYMKKKEYLYDLMDQCTATLDREMDDLPECMIHQDINPGNMMYYENGEVAAIFDLDWVARGKRLYDVAWMAQQMLSTWNEDEFGQIDLRKMELFLKSYNEAAVTGPLGVLTEAECRSFSAMILATELNVVRDFVDLVYCDREKNDYEYYLFFHKYMRMIKDTMAKYYEFNELAALTSRNAVKKIQE